MMDDHEFERLAQLFRDDPEAFNRERERIIEEFIAGIDDPVRRRRLECFQWRLDTERASFRGDDQQWLNYVFGKMWASFVGLNDHLQAFVENGQFPEAPRKEGRLVLFEKKED